MKTKETIGIFWKPFLFFFIIIFLIVNWQGINWQKALVVSNYQYLYASAKEFLIPAQDRGLDFLEKTNFIKIKKINLKAPLTFSQGTDLKSLSQKLKQGVLHYPFSALPNQDGTVIILGHSASIYWPDNNYDKVFNQLDELGPGDEIIIYFAGRHYFYQVNEMFFPKPGEQVITQNNLENFNELVLITCWPLGNSRGRLAIRARLNNE